MNMIYSRGNKIRDSDEFEYMQENELKELVKKLSEIKGYKRDYKPFLKYKEDVFSKMVIVNKKKF